MTRSQKMKGQLARSLTMPRGPERWELTAWLAACALENHPPITLAVSGSRYVHDAQEVLAMMRPFLGDPPIETGPHLAGVVQGGARGVDAVVDAALALHHEEVIELVCGRGADKLPQPLKSRAIAARWGKTGLVAGPIRNGELLDAADAWCGLWDGRKERCGTYDAAKQAAARGWIGWAMPRSQGKPGAWLYAMRPNVFEEGL